MMDDWRNLVPGTGQLLAIDAVRTDDGLPLSVDARLGSWAVEPDSHGIASFAELIATRTGNYVLVAVPALGLNDNGPVNTTFGPTVRVNPGPASALAFATQPGGRLQVGKAFGRQPRVHIVDEFGNNVPGIETPVALTIFSGPVGGRLAPNETVVVNTTAPFSTALFEGLSVVSVPGVYSLVASASLATVSEAISIAVGVPLYAPEKINVSLTGAAANGTVETTVPFGALVHVMNETWHLLTDDSESLIALAVSSPHCPSPCDLGFVSTAVFAGTLRTADDALSLAPAGNYSLVAKTGDVASEAVIFAVTAGPPAALVFVAEPGPSDAPPAMRVNLPFLIQPVVELHDKGGNTVSDEDFDMALIEIFSGPGQLVGGDVAVAFVDGVAAFSNLAVNAPGQYVFDVIAINRSSLASGFVVRSGIVHINGPLNVVPDRDCFARMANLTECPACGTHVVRQMYLVEEHPVGDGLPCQLANGTLVDVPCTSPCPPGARAPGYFGMPSRYSMPLFDLDNPSLVTVSRTVLFKNLGHDPVRLVSASVETGSGGASFELKLDADLPATVMGGSFVSARLFFSPPPSKRSPALFTGRLVMQGTDAIGAQTIPIVAETVHRPHVSVSLEDRAPVAMNGRMSAGIVYLDDEHVPTWSVLLANMGGKDLIVSNVILGAADASQSHVTVETMPAFPLLIAPGQSVAFSLSVMVVGATSSAVVSRTLTIVSNSAEPSSTAAGLFPFTFAVDLRVRGSLSGCNIGGTFEAASAARGFGSEIVRSCLLLNTGAVDIQSAVHVDLAQSSKLGGVSMMAEISTEGTARFSPGASKVLIMVVDLGAAATDLSQWSAALTISLGDGRSAVIQVVGQIVDVAWFTESKRVLVESESTSLVISSSAPLRTPLALPILLTQGSDADVRLSSWSMGFAVGAESADVVLTVRNDAEAEPAETVVFALGSIGGPAIEVIIAASDQGPISTTIDENENDDVVEIVAVPTVLSDGNAAVSNETKLVVRIAKSALSGQSSVLVGFVMAKSQAVAGDLPATRKPLEFTFDVPGKKFAGYSFVVELDENVQLVDTIFVESPYNCDADPSSLELRLFDTEKLSWESAADYCATGNLISDPEINIEDCTATFEICHLTQFAVFAAADDAIEPEPEGEVSGAADENASLNGSNGEVDDADVVLSATFVTLAVAAILALAVVVIARRRRRRPTAAYVDSEDDDVVDDDSSADYSSGFSLSFRNARAEFSDASSDTGLSRSM